MRRHWKTWLGRLLLLILLSSMLVMLGLPVFLGEGPDWLQSALARQRAADRSFLEQVPANLPRPTKQSPANPRPP